MDISPKLFVRKVFMMLVIARVFRTLSYFFIVTASILPLQLAFASTTTVLQDGLSGYTGTTDTFINAFIPPTNEGGNTTPYSSSYGSNKILVHFDISLIPFGATISSATLSLYISSNTGNGGRNTVNLYRLNRDWIETQATWNAYATGNSWTTAGIGSGADMSTVVDSVPTVGYSPANIWANFDVISLVQGWVNGTNQNYGVTVFPSGGPSVNVYSSEYGIDTMLRPKLTITYTGGTTPPPSDTSIPTTPTNLSATAVSSSQINLTWTASTDNVGVTGYNVYRGGVQIASVANTSYNDTGLSANTSYTYYVRATDAAGNISNQSISVSATTQFTTPPPPDTPPPPSDTSIPTTPTNLSATAASSSQINLSWTASTDNVGVTGYDIYRNNTFLTTTTGTSYSNTALSANTTYSYYVRAKDVAGNVSSPSTTVSGTTQSTTSPPPSAKFSLNDRVQVQSGPLNVRATASATGTLLGSQGTGNLGTIIGGPISANGFNWWNINYDNAPDGWSAEDYVVKYTASTPPPSTDCSATSVRCVDDTAGSTQEYSTIQAAINAASAGDTILVHDGTYAGFGIRSKSGTATNPITIRGIGRALINQKEPGGSGEFIYTTFSGYFIIENLEVDCTSGTGFCVGIHSGSTTPNRGIVIRGNKVYNGQSTNIYLSHAADSLVENNITYGSRASHGIYLANGGSDNTTIRGNLSYNNSKNGIHLNGDLSVGGDGLITGVVIEQNILHDNNLQGVDMDGAQNGTIRNNLIYNNRYIGIVGFQLGGATGQKNHKIYNNTIMIPSTSGNYAIEMKDGDLGGHTIFNNILMTAGSGGSIAVGNTKFPSNDNIVIGKFSVDEESTTMNFASWQSRGYDTNSIVSTASALFTNSTTNDYTLKSGSPAIDKGVSAFNAVSAPTTDILGVSR